MCTPSLRKGTVAMAVHGGRAHEARRLAIDWGEWRHSTLVAPLHEKWLREQALAKSRRRASAVSSTRRQSPTPSRLQIGMCVCSHPPDEGGRRFTAVLVATSYLA